MNKRLITLLLAAGIAVIFVATGLQAGTTVDDVITMESKVYKKHKKGLSQFTHKKHNEDYAISCDKCHHDKDGKPLEGLKIGDDVQKCDECHNIAKGKNKTHESYKKKKDGKAIMVDIMEHKIALHENCMGCHKEMKVKKGTSCGTCHPKKKK